MERIVVNRRQLLRTPTRLISVMLDSPMAHARFIFLIVLLAWAAVLGSSAAGAVAWEWTGGSKTHGES
jgi:hypothetical protein